MISKKAKEIPPFIVMDVLEKAQELERMGGRHEPPGKLPEEIFPMNINANCKISTSKLMVSQKSENALKGYPLHSTFWRLSV